MYGPIAAAFGQFVLAQVGQSLDGRVATPSGDARDISGPDGLAHLHRCRALVDAVIVGENTVSCNDPRKWTGQTRHVWSSIAMGGFPDRKACLMTAARE